MPAANPQNTRKRQVKMVPHGPGGQRVRPTPVRVQSRTPAAKRKGVQVVKRASSNVRNVPTSPGGQNVRSVTVHTKPRTHAQKVQGVKVVKQSAKRVDRREQKAARKYITQNPIKGLKKSEDRAVESLSMAPNKKSEISKILHAVSKVEPVTVAAHTVKSILKEGAKHVHLQGTSQHNLAAMTTPQLHAISASPASKVAGKVIENAAREAIDLPANTVPQVIHIAKPAYKHPFSPKAYVKSAERAGEAAIALPKEYVKAYEKKGLKGVGDTAVKHPLTTALTLAPIPRAPGLVAGKIASRAGSITRGPLKHVPGMPKIEPKTLPGTALKENVPRSKSYFHAKRQAKKHNVSGAREAERATSAKLAEVNARLDRMTPGTQAYNSVKTEADKLYKDLDKHRKAQTKGEITDKQGVFSSPIERHIDEQVARSEDLARRAQADTFKKAYKDQKKRPGVTKKKARNTAAQLAKKAQEEVRKEQSHKLVEGVGLLERGKAVASGADTKSALKTARNKERAARKALTKLPWVQGQLLRNTGHTIADWTKLEDAETRLWTLHEHHTAEAENARALGNDALEKQHQRMADAASKAMTPIEGELEKLHRVFTNSKGNAGAAQLEADLKHSNYVNARKERQALEANPSNIRTLPPSGKILVTNATQALREAERYNRTHKVTMVPHRTEGGYAVIPESAAKRIKGHEASTEAGAGEAAFKVYNQLWRKTALVTHPTWHLGNPAEAGLRSAVEKVGPFSFYRGLKVNKVYKQTYGKAATDEMRANISKGGHMKMQTTLPEETDIRITGGGKGNDAARALQSYRQAPVIRQVADGWTHVTDLLMGTLQGGMESGFQTGMMGKALERHPMMDKHMWRTSNAAIADAVKGLHDTPNMAELGRTVDKMYGQYGKFSPGMRRAIANYTPFIAWTLNSLKWLYYYMPKDHPVLTAAAASAQPYVDEWLKDKGLSAYVKGALPPFLQGSVPVKGGYTRWPTRYTPFAIAAGMPEGLASALLPQIEGTYNLWTHQINWKGQKVTNPDGSPLNPSQLIALGLVTLGQGMIPEAQQLVDPVGKYEAGIRKPGKLVKPKSIGEIAHAHNPLSVVRSPKDKKAKSKSLYDTKSSKTKSLYDSPTKKQKSLYDSP